MASMSVVLGAVFVGGLMILGLVQFALDYRAGEQPGVALAGAVTAGPTQEELNVCMNGCMHDCVTVAGTEDPCLEECNQQCGA